MIVGAAWQRCRVHFMRNVLARVPIADKLGRQFPAVEQMINQAAPTSAPRRLSQSHWRRVWSTNPLERVNGEIKRRADVAGIFPNEAAIVRLVGAVLMETHDEWQITR